MGKTNFVSLKIDETIIEEIHKICLDLEKNIEEFKFTPMEKKNIHMTLCYIGSCLNTDRKNKLAICNINFTHFEETFRGNILRIKNISLFGSNNNLIIAEFECVNNKNFIKDMIKFKKKFEEIGTKNENYFTPHITLGKINNFNPNEKNINILNKILSKIDHTIQNITINSCFMA